ncbi:hypothetical protein K7432_002094 [Basidiobolus ranarum]|uniref:Uncharacterized protein n=1 Tax=Basidiobolus ranarum TaxID=34480 RepID=A0ABR2X2B8_9FUNG
MTTNSALLTPVITLLSIIWLTLFVLPVSLVTLGVELSDRLRALVFQRKASPAVFRNILITGAATGIGRELANAYAALETTDSLGLVDINEPGIEKTAQELRTLFPKVQVVTYVADVSDPEAMQRLIQDFDSRKMDLVIANAGVLIAPRDGVSQLTEHPDWGNDVRKTMQVNLLGVVNTVAPAVTQFKTRKSGHVVVTCSISAFYGTPVLASYSASKAAVFRFIRDLGSQLRKDGIYTTCVCPGFIDTALIQIDMYKSDKIPFLLSANQATQMMVEGIACREETIAFPFPSHLFCWLFNCTPPLVMNRIQRYLANK